MQIYSVERATEVVIAIKQLAILKLDGWFREVSDGIDPYIIRRFLPEALLEGIKGLSGPCRQTVKSSYIWWLYTKYDGCKITSAAPIMKCSRDRSMYLVKKKLQYKKGFAEVLVDELYEFANLI